MNIILDMEQGLQSEVRPLLLLSLLVIAIITAMLDGKAKRTEHVNVALVVLLGELLLPFLHGGIESLTPDGLVAVNPRKSSDISFLNGFVLNTKKQFASFFNGFLLLLRRAVGGELLLK